MKTKYYKKPIINTKRSHPGIKSERKIGYPGICKADNCGVKIIWLPTKLGKWMPVEFGSIPPEDLHEINLGGVVFYNKERHQTHFGRCTQTERFSRK